MSFPLCLFPLRYGGTLIDFKHNLILPETDLSNLESNLILYLYEKALEWKNCFDNKISNPETERINKDTNGDGIRDIENLLYGIENNLLKFEIQNNEKKAIVHIHFPEQKFKPEQCCTIIGMKNNPLLNGQYITVLKNMTCSRKTKVRLISEGKNIWIPESNIQEIKCACNNVIFEHESKRECCMMHGNCYLDSLKNTGMCKCGNQFDKIAMFFGGNLSQEQCDYYNRNFKLMLGLHKGELIKGPRLMFDKYIRAINPVNYSWDSMKISHLTKLGVLKIVIKDFNFAVIIPKKFKDDYDELENPEIQEN